MTERLSGNSNVLPPVNLSPIVRDIDLQHFVDGLCEWGYDFTPYKHRTTVDRAMSVAAGIVQEAICLPENLNSGRLGGCLVVADSVRHYPPVPIFVGHAQKADPEYGIKKEKYILYALAKAAVLINNPKLRASNQNSGEKEHRQLRMGTNPVPGGGFRFPNGKILTFSGFSQQVDEAVALTVAVQAGLATLNQVKRIAERMALPETKEHLDLLLH